MAPVKGSIECCLKVSAMVPSQAQRQAPYEGFDGVFYKGGLPRLLSRLRFELLLWLLPWLLARLITGVMHGIPKPGRI